MTAGILFAGAYLIHIRPHERSRNRLAAADISKYGVCVYFQIEQDDESAEWSDVRNRTGEMRFVACSLSYACPEIGAVV